MLIIKAKLEVLNGRYLASNPNIGAFNHFTNKTLKTP